jgi:hypothetical protein
MKSPKKMYLQTLHPQRLYRQEEERIVWLLLSMMKKLQQQQVLLSRTTTAQKAPKLPELRLQATTYPRKLDFSFE